MTVREGYRGKDLPAGVRAVPPKGPAAGIPIESRAAVAESGAGAAAAVERERRGTEAELERLETELRRLQNASRLGTDLRAEATAKAMEADPLEAEANLLLDRKASFHAASEAAREGAGAAELRVREAAERIHLLSKPGQACTVCEQGLDDHRRDRLLRALDREYLVASEERDDAARIVRTHQAERDRLRSEAERRSREAADIRAHIAELHRGIERAEAAAERIPAVISEIENRRARLAELLEGSAGAAPGGSRAFPTAPLSASEEASSR